jgi:hypothetical protein
MICEFKICLKRTIEQRGKPFFINWSHHHAPHTLLHANRAQITRRLLEKRDIVGGWLGGGCGWAI